MCSAEEEVLVVVVVVVCGEGGWEGVEVGGVEGKKVHVSLSVFAFVGG